MFIEQNQGVVRRGLEGVEVLLTYIIIYWGNSRKFSEKFIFNTTPWQIGTLKYFEIKIKKCPSGAMRGK